MLFPSEQRILHHRIRLGYILVRVLGFVKQTSQRSVFVFKPMFEHDKPNWGRRHSIKVKTAFNNKILHSQAFPIYLIKTSSYRQKYVNLVCHGRLLVIICRRQHHEKNSWMVSQIPDLH